MFDATRLLGGLIDTGLGGSSLGGSTPAPPPAADNGGSGLGTMGTVAAVAGVAAVGGLAYAAYRHHKAGGFGQGGPGLFGGGQQTVQQAPAAMPSPMQAAGFGQQTGFGQQGGFGQQPTGFAGAQPPGGASPPAFTSAEGAGFGQPAARVSPPAAPAAQPPTDQQHPTDQQCHMDQQGQALLLVRAMIAAANVDGRIDAAEQQKVLRGAEQAGFGPAERQALERELAAPQPPNVLLGQVRDAELAAQFYLVTLLALDIDSDVEKTYARALPIILQIPAPRVAQIHAQLGVPQL